MKSKFCLQTQLAILDVLKCSNMPLSISNIAAAATTLTKDKPVSQERLVDGQTQNRIAVAKYRTFGY